MFKLKIRNLNSDYGNTNEQLVTDFLRSIGFLGNDGGRNKVTKRSQTGILLFTKCLIPNPKKSWTTSEIAKELGVPLQAIYRHCLLYTSPSPRDRQKSRMPSSA